MPSSVLHPKSMLYYSARSAEILCPRYSMVGSMKATLACFSSSSFQLVVTISVLLANSVDVHSRSSMRLAI